VKPICGHNAFGLSENYKYQPDKNSIMVSFELYLRTFVRVMPKRMRVLHRALRIKRRLDGKLGKRNKPAVVSHLQRIIGEDALFNSAEKRNKQTIRHMLWKIEKSIGFFCSQESGNFMLYLERESVKDGAQKDPLFSFARSMYWELQRALSQSGFFSLLGELSKNYSMQAQALAKNELGNYFSLLKAEEELINNIGSFSQIIEGQKPKLDSMLRELNRRDIPMRLESLIMSANSTMLYTLAAFAVFIYTNIPDLHKTLFYLSSIIFEKRAGVHFYSVKAQLVHAKALEQMSEFGKYFL
jgi:hypothetical protein